jgi:hypothetical protein
LSAETDEEEENNDSLHIVEPDAESDINYGSSSDEEEQEDGLNTINQSINRLNFNSKKK